MIGLGKKIRGFVTIIITTISISGCSSSVPTVVAFSDMHFNPFYDTAIFTELVNSSVDDWAEIFEASSVTENVTWGEEADYNLMKNSIQQVCTKADDNYFVIFAGDILRHNFDSIFYNLYGSEDVTAMRAFTYKTVAFFSNEVRKYCSDVPVVFALGNNDSYEGDYEIEPGGAFLSDTSTLFYETLLQSKADTDNFTATYTAGGYYSTNLLASDLTVIILNTVLFSPYAATGSESAANTQLEWLDSELASARGNNRRVWLVLHIPPGADIYGTVANYMDDSGQVSDASTMWQPAFQQSYNEIVADYSDIIDSIFSGHTHMDEYRLSVENSSDLHGAVISIPAITPFFGNNPAFKTLTLVWGAWQIENYHSFYNPLASGNLSFSSYYSFASVYNMNELLDAALADLAPELNTNGTKKQAYINYYYLGHESSNPINNINWPAYHCGITKMDKDDYIDCINSE